jgi:hypothetical protein
MGPGMIFTIKEALRNTQIFGSKNINYLLNLLPLKLLGLMVQVLVFLLLYFNVGS